MAQIFLLTGDNAFAIREERRRWIQEFARKYGDENLVRLQAQGLTIRALLDEVAVAPFIAERRLVVIEGVPKCTKDETEALERAIHPQTVVLAIDRKTGERRSPGREFHKIADVREFPPLKGKALRQWVGGFAASCGAHVESDGVEALIELVGEDQDVIAREVEKLALFAAGRGIGRADVDALAVPSEGVIWKLTDLLAGGQRTQALRYAHGLIRRGGEPYALWNVLLGFLRNAILVAAASESARGAKDVAEKSGVNFWAVRSLLPYAERVDRPALVAFLDAAVDADMALKTGGYRATEDAPQELLALIDRFVLRCPA